MSHFSYTEERKDLRPLIDSICGWVELNWQIGGIAFHKVRDLEERLSKLIPKKYDGLLFSTESMKERFVLVKYGYMTKEEFLSAYPKNMAWVHDNPDGSPLTFSVDNSILTDPIYHPRLNEWIKQEQK